MTHLAETADPSWRIAAALRVVSAVAGVLIYRRDTRGEPINKEATERFAGPNGLAHAEAAYAEGKAVADTNGGIWDPAFSGIKELLEKLPGWTYGAVASDTTRRQYELRIGATQPKT